MKSVFCGVAVVAPAQGYPIHALAPRRPFTIVIGTGQSVFKAGSEIRLHITLTNTSAHDIVIWRANGDAQGEVAGYRVEVRDENGNGPPETKYQRVLRGEDEDSLVWSPIGMDLSPGKSSKDAMIVNKFYDLSKPGKYKIQVHWTDRTSKTVVKSNTITVTVTQ